MSCSLVEFGRLQELKTVRDFLFQSHNPDPSEENQQTGTAPSPFSDDKALVPSISKQAVLRAERSGGVTLKQAVGLNVKLESLKQSVSQLHTIH